MKCTEYGYTLSLHQEKTNPENGYGYNHPDIPVSQIALAELKKIADDWNANGIVFDPALGKWIMTELKESAETSVTAELVASYPWAQYANLKGFVFSRAGVRLPGMITVHCGDEGGVSFSNDWKRYSTMNATVVYGEMVDSKDNRIIDYIEWGPFSDLTKEEALGAIEAALETVDA